MRSIIKRIKWISAISDLLVMYVFSMGISGLCYYSSLKRGYEFSVEELTDEYFFNLTGKVFCIYFIFVVLWIIVRWLFWGESSYLKPKSIRYILKCNDLPEVFITLLQNKEFCMDFAAKMDCYDWDNTDLKSEIEGISIKAFLQGLEKMPDECCIGYERKIKY